jgi:hypothetical protein
MSSLSNINQYRHIVRCISSVAAYWSHTHGAAGSNLGQILSCSHLLKLCIFRKSITMYHCMALLQVALVSIPPHKFVCPPCLYYWSQEIVKHDFRVVPNGITSRPNFIQICPAVLKLIMTTDKHDQPYIRSFLAHHAKNIVIKKPFRNNNICKFMYYAFIYHVLTFILLGDMFQTYLHR